MNAVVFQPPAPIINCEKTKCISTLTQLLKYYTIPKSYLGLAKQLFNVIGLKKQNSRTDPALPPPHPLQEAPAPLALTHQHRPVIPAMPCLPEELTLTN